MNTTTLDERCANLFFGSISMKNKSTYLILALIIILIYFSLKLSSSQNQRIELQNHIDFKYKSQIGLVLGSFSTIVDDYTYRDMISNVLSLSVMSELTTYEKKNDDLDISLHNLYISLRENRSKDKVLARVDEVREAFFIMSQDPSSREATNKLIEISNDTFFSTEE
ncbi:hypothetical protein [Cohnella yongneupensis]|uniref:Uncharacterized protein n=1 Tax=Cohnella yongneupensis TaxID=425006 RepID=A0ABW0QWI4_9BACL